MKKRGFTLIEVIICLALLAVVGGTMVSVKYFNKKEETEFLINNEDKLSNALEVYLSKNKSVLNNVNNNAKAAVVSLELLKNEGLIDNNYDINYKNNYFVLSNATLLNNNDTKNIDCSNNVVAIEIINSWDLSKYDTSKVIYVCPREGSSSGDSTSSLITPNSSDPSKKTPYIAQGENPNNWVVFPVKNDSSVTSYYSNKINSYQGHDESVKQTVNYGSKGAWAYWPDDKDQDLWRIMSIDESGVVKLIYNKPVGANNNVNYVHGNKDGDGCMLYTNPGTLVSRFDSSDAKFCQVRTNCYGFEHNKSGDNKKWTAFVKYKANNIWTSSEIISEYSGYAEYDGTDLDKKVGDREEFKSKQNNCYYGQTFNWDTGTSTYQGKKVHLYNNIENNDWLVNSKYPVKFPCKEGVTPPEGEDSCIDNLDLNIGFLSKNDYNNSLYAGKTWLPDYLEIPHYYEDATLVSAGDSGSVTLGGRTFYYSSNVGTNYYAFYELDGYEYYPVITLKNTVKIVKPEKCDGTLGSYTCPYKLEM